MSDDIEVTGCDLRLLIAKAYELSVPQGLGFLHATPGPLDEATIDEILERSKGDPIGPVGMDYVNGRSIKLRVRERGGKLWIPARWYDHSENQLKALCEAIGVEWPKATCLDDVSAESLGN
jgi:hypothetical protein